MMIDEMDAPAAYMHGWNSGHRDGVELVAQFAFSIMLDEREYYDEKNDRVVVNLIDRLTSRLDAYLDDMSEE